VESAAGRAAIQGKAETVRMICDLAGRPSLDKWTLAGPAYTLSVEGTAVLLALGARVVGPAGVDHNTMEHLLGTDSRNPPAKHRILEMYVEHGFEPPDTTSIGGGLARRRARRPCAPVESGRSRPTPPSWMPDK
jgi:hypothetical protein